MIIWFKCDPSQGDWTTCPVAFNSSLTSKNGRVSLLESDIRKKNCSIRINNFIDSDSGSYQLRVEGSGPGDEYVYRVAKTTLSSTALKQKPTLVVPPLTEGQQTTLTCTAPGLCSGSPPNITWSWRRGGEEDFTITGNITGFHTENLTNFTQRHSSTLTFHPSAEHHDTSITCKISFTGDTTTEETVTLNVTSIMKECGDHCGAVPWAVAAASLSVNVLCLVSMWLLWNKSKKVKPNQEDRTYMSLQKMDTSPEYDVIIQNKHGKVRTARTVGPRLSEQISLSIQWLMKSHSDSTTLCGQNNTLATSELPVRPLLVGGAVEWSGAGMVEPGSASSTFSALSKSAERSNKTKMVNSLVSAAIMMSLEQGRRQVERKCLFAEIGSDITVLRMSARTHFLLQHCGKNNTTMQKVHEKPLRLHHPLWPEHHTCNFRVAGPAPASGRSCGVEWSWHGGAGVCFQHIFCMFLMVSRLDTENLDWGEGSLGLKLLPPHYSILDQWRKMKTLLVLSDVTSRWGPFCGGSECLCSASDRVLQTPTSPRFSSSFTGCQSTSVSKAAERSNKTKMVNSLVSAAIMMSLEQGRRQVTDEKPTANEARGGTEGFSHQIRMFVLIWVTLFMSVRGSDADPAQPNGMREHCRHHGYCVSLNDGVVTAEAGLCVEIPCSFTSLFDPEMIISFKCDPSQGDWMKCPVAFNSSLTSKNGRVSLLESDISKKNCSIRINNLIDSDSGSYLLRVEGRGPGHKYTYTVAKTTLSLTALKQKPTLVVPPLTEGQQTTLTCTAPGLCSGSPPNITWSWRGEEEEDFTITGNITGFHTENLTDFIQRHSSTLTFNPSAEHHDTSITCKTSFTGDTATEETVTLSVTYLKKVIISGNPKVKEGETLNLTCSVDSFPPSDITWTKSGRHRHLKKQDYKRSQQDRRGIGLFSISNVTAEQAGLYVCTAEHRSNTTRKRVNVTVIYKRSLQITGNPSIIKGEDLNLTCSIESFPPSLIKWTKHSENKVYVQTDSGSASLLIPNVTREDSGRYICTAEHLDEKVSVDADVTVTWFSKILKGSGCVLQSEVLTCVCASEGFPLPTIRWSLLKNHTEYSVTTKVSNHTVNSSITISHHGNISVECFSSNGVGGATENLTITDNSPDEGKGDPGGSVPWAVAAASLSVNVLCLICMLLLWNKNKKVKPNQEDRTYMSLQKVDTSPEYDVIVHQQL
ncbi:uncharacterized protein [Nothobranchius furzeri]|uniref:uncharacterized protein n=1 Tax=Nothobranchius furzeri TaxID=105023 RepID=UPI0039048FE5